jgi:hypothetical protein
MNVGLVSERFLDLGIQSFLDACRFVHDLPYGYNTDRDDPMILFKENKGTCTTKHAVVATLAQELDLPIEKNLGIYAMTEEIVTGTKKILIKYNLPFVPMIHCFLAYGENKVDLTEDNLNGKNRSIEEFLFTQQVEPNISAKDEYLLFRMVLNDHIRHRPELKGTDMRLILHAREEGLQLLKNNVSRS